MVVEIPGQVGHAGQSRHRAGDRGGGRHRRSEADVLEAVASYELLTVVLRRHRPGERAGLCLVCGTGWPCRDVLSPLEDRCSLPQWSAGRNGCEVFGVRV